MRIISGEFRGRKLIRPKDTTVRPTADRIREALFNIIGPRIRGSRVLDLFAGTGALGLEALSRGANEAVFIDHHTTLVKDNIALCRVEKQSVVLKRNLASPQEVTGLGEQPFDLIFMDPPYHLGLIDQLLSRKWLIDSLAENGTIVVEQDHTESIKFLPSDLDIYRQKKYSRTLISFIGK